MISKVLSKETCKECKFCCVFRKESLWELPVFPKDSNVNKNELVDEKQFYRMNLEDKYKTNDVNETVPCIFLDENKGCTLNDEDKPLECKIWPLRVMKKDENFVVAFETVCPYLGEKPSNELKNLVEEIGDAIKEYTLKYPFIAKEYDEKFPILLTFKRND